MEMLITVMSCWCKVLNLYYVYKLSILSNKTLFSLNVLLVLAIAGSFFVATQKELVASVHKAVYPQTVFANPYAASGTYMPTEVIEEVQEVDEVVEIVAVEEYFEVVDSCGSDYVGDCLLVRSGPGEEFPVVSRLRNGIVLKVGEKIESETGQWYEVVFDEWLRYPERVTGKWYVSSKYVELFNDVGVLNGHSNKFEANAKKTITVDQSEQMLYAFEGNELFLQTSISTGLSFTPTPNGTFKIYRKTPTRYMQGPLPGLADQESYDLPGVPWNLYFTEGGAVIHGAYWHESFGSQYSHGCVNVSLNTARELYEWAEVGTEVIVKR
jgi:hypothetical protein